MPSRGPAALHYKPVTAAAGLGARPHTCWPTHATICAMLMGLPLLPHWLMMRGLLVGTSVWGSEGSAGRRRGATHEGRHEGKGGRGGRAEGASHTREVAKCQVQAVSQALWRARSCAL